MARGIQLKRALAPRAGLVAEIAWQKGWKTGSAESTVHRQAWARWSGSCCQTRAEILTWECLYVIASPAHARLNMWEAGQEISQLQGC